MWFKTVLLIKFASTYDLDHHTLNVNTAIIRDTGFTSQQGHHSKLSHSTKTLPVHPPWAEQTCQQF